ncbi:hypothetical protein BFW01_g8928 [Lasiodiplodia theobromae]|nr:hypothetical protein BFW01_g8928 [Lasiodiplodia theobromae]
MDFSWSKKEFSSQKKAALMRQESRPRRPFPTRRQSLSGTLDSTKKMHDQSQSPFFKLPAELRRAIYSEAGLGNATIHCFTREFENQTGADTCPVERLTKKTSTNIYHGKVCTHPQNGSSSAAPYSGDAPNHCSGCATASRQALTCLPASFIDLDHLRGSSTSSPSSCIVPLLQTCRRLYTEAIATLYAETTFSFTDLFTLTDFLTSAIPRAHASRIRSLALTWTLLTQPIVPRSSLSPGMVWGAGGVVRALLLPGLRRLRLELADRVDDGCGSEGVGQLRHAHGVWGRRGTAAYARPEELWVEWLRPVGEALEGREEVVVEGGIWCRFDKEGSRHAVIKGGGEEKRVLVLADGEEVEW